MFSVTDSLYISISMVLVWPFVLNATVYLHQDLVITMAADPRAHYWAINRYGVDYNWEHNFLPNFCCYHGYWINVYRRDNIMQNSQGYLTISCSTFRDQTRRPPAGEIVNSLVHSQTTNKTWLVTFFIFLSDIYQPTRWKHRMTWAHITPVLT